MPTFRDNEQALYGKS